jgi:hypothetical protein
MSQITSYSYIAPFTGKSKFHVPNENDFVESERDVVGSGNCSICLLYIPERQENREDALPSSGKPPLPLIWIPQIAYCDSISSCVIRTMQDIRKEDMCDTSCG